MLLCVEYGILFVNTVNTKIKARNALVEYEGSYDQKCTDNVDTVDTVEKPLFRAF